MEVVAGTETLWQGLLFAEDHKVDLQEFSPNGQDGSIMPPSDDEPL
jgi:hypothetical protein